MLPRFNDCTYTFTIGFSKQLDSPYNWTLHTIKSDQQRHNETTHFGNFTGVIFLKIVNFGHFQTEKAHFGPFSSFDGVDGVMPITPLVTSDTCIDTVILYTFLPVQFLTYYLNLNVQSNVKCASPTGAGRIPSARL